MCVWFFGGGAQTQEVPARVPCPQTPHLTSAQLPWLSAAGVMQRGKSEIIPGHRAKAASDDISSSFIFSPFSLHNLYIYRDQLTFLYHFPLHCVAEAQRPCMPLQLCQLLHPCLRVKKGCRQFHYKIVSARYCTFASLLALFNTFNLQLCVLCVTDGSTVVRIQCLLFQM